jgi:hypothetical protein
LEKFQVVVLLLVDTIGRKKQVYAEMMGYFEGAGTGWLAEVWQNIPAGISIIRTGIRSLLLFFMKLY